VKRRWRNRIVGSADVPPGDLVANPRNWRAHPDAQRGALEGVLDEVGWVQQVVVNKRTGFILDGHLRVALALSRKEPTIPVLYVDLDEDEEKLTLATLDPLAAAAETDPEALADLLSDVQTGNDAVRDLLDSLAEGIGREFDSDSDETAEPRVDEAEELRAKWGVEPGQVWTIGEHKLLVGDCTDIGAVEALFAGERARMAVTSPPYGVGKEYEEGEAFGDLVELIDKTAEVGARVVVPGGYFVVNFGDIYVKSIVERITGDASYGVFLMSCIYNERFRKHGWKLWANRIWRKPFERLPAPFWSYHSTIPHHQEWEYVWSFRAPGGEDDEPEELVIRRIPARSAELLEDDIVAQQWMESLWRVFSGVPIEGYDFVWTFRSKGGKERRLPRRKWRMSVHAVWSTHDAEGSPLRYHVAAFPLELPRRAIEVYSEQGDLVWEPFLGSGTTLLACERLRRRCIATEREPRYVAVALERFADDGLNPELEV